VVSQHTVTAIERALVDGIQQLEGGYHRASGQHLNFQAPTRHVVDLFGEVVGVFMEDVFGWPSALEAQRRGLRARHHGRRHGACCNGGAFQYVTACRCFLALGHTGLLMLCVFDIE
jgi:hypothetical protein